MWRLLGIVGKGMLPPRDDSSPRVWRWRLTIAGLVALLLLTSAGHIAMACGYIPGWSGFALAAEVREVDDKLSSMQRALIEERILKMRERQCRAISNDNEMARRFAAERMSELQREYRQMFGYAYDAPPCGAL